jgi:hypothetical protein
MVPLDHSDSHEILEGTRATLYCGMTPYIIDLYRDTTRFCRLFVGRPFFIVDLDLLIVDHI